MSSIKEGEVDFKFPIVLPKDHQVVKLMIWQKYVSLSHAGVNVLMTQKRENFWILQSRKAI